MAPTHTCLCCKFTTPKKSTYDNHINGKKHTELMKTFLQTECKTKTSNSNQLESNIFNVDTYLNSINSHALEFDYFITEYLFNPNHQDMFIFVSKGDTEIQLLSTLNYNHYPKSKEIPVSFFCKIFNQLEHFQKPIFCSNVKENKYHIKQNGTWSIIDKNILFTKLFNVLIRAMTISLYNMSQLSNKHFQQIYNCDKEQWINNGKDELTVIMFGVDLQEFINLFNNELSKLCNRKQTKYDIPEANNWTEFEDNCKIIDTDDDSD